MKTIQDVQIWDNGQIKNASVLNAYATLNLNKDATFTYYLYSVDENDLINESLTSGNLYMNPEIYATWEQDDIAWDFIANQLNLVITGDYVAPEILINKVLTVSEENI